MALNSWRSTPRRSVTTCEGVALRHALPRKWVVPSTTVGQHLRRVDGYGESVVTQGSSPFRVYVLAPSGVIVVGLGALLMIGFAQVAVQKTSTPNAAKPSSWSPAPGRSELQGRGD
jgi:hypothetical protein